MTQQRQHFRLRYPMAAQPSLTVEATSYPVTELSEGGMRLLPGAHGRFAPTGQIRGLLALASGASIDVLGTVIRLEDHEVIVRLAAGPTYSEMMDEQRYVARRFPDWPQTR
jgi:hypothetical protein